MKISFNAQETGLHLLGEGGVEERLKTLFENKNIAVSFRKWEVTLEGPDLVKGDEEKIKTAFNLSEVRVSGEVRAVRMFLPHPHS